MLKDDIIICGVGQAGSNVTVEFENLGFNTFYVNTAIEDLDLIETEQENKFHIKGTGMAKDREYATEVIKSNDNAGRICDAIYNRYPMAKIVYFIYSTGGGTGGTMGNVIASSMTSYYPSLCVNSVVITPKHNEDIGIQINSKECLDELYKMVEAGLVNNIQILTNNSKDNKLSINSEFALQFDSLVSLDSISEDGNLDSGEMFRLLTNSGVSVVIEFDCDNFGEGLTNAIDDSIYAPWLKNPSECGYILSKEQDEDINIEILRRELGIPNLTHRTNWNATNNVIIVTGMSINRAVINSISKSANELIEQKIKIESELQKPYIEDIAIKTDAIQSRRTTRPNTRNQRTASNSRGGRKTRNTVDVNEILNKIRSI